MNALARKFVQDYPYPVALPYRIARDEDEELARRLWAIPFTALQAVKLTSLVHRAHPEHVEIADGLAGVLGNLGNLLSAQGQAEAARRCYERAAELYEALHRAHPEHVEIADGLRS